MRTNERMVARYNVGACVSWCALLETAEVAWMKIAYLPIGVALSLTLMLMPLANLVWASQGPRDSKVARSAAPQFAQNESTDPYNNSPVEQPENSGATVDQPENNAATNQNSDQSNAESGDDNSASSNPGASDENSGESAQMNSPDNSDNSDQSSPNPENDQQNQDSGNTQ